jgi:PmbA protein
MAVDANVPALLEAALGALRAAGAEGDAYLEERRTLRLRVREQKLDEIAQAESLGVGIRAIRDGRLGFVHTSAASPEAVARAAASAVDLARAATVRDDLLLAEPGPNRDGRDEGTALELFDPAIERQPLGEKEARARATEAAALGADPRIRRSNGAGYQEVLRSVWIANTRGLFRHARRSELEVDVEPVAEAAGEMQTGGISHQATRWQDLPAPAALGARAGKRAVDLLGGQPVATGSYPVIFTPEAGFTVLLYLATALNGDHLSRGRSWLGERMQAPLGTERVTVHNDGRRPRGLGALPFDGEGVDTRRTTLLERGRIGEALTDLAAGKRLGKPSTGSALRGGYEALPGIQTQDLWLEPGPEKPEALIAGVERGLLILDLAGWWIGMNPSNPSYSSAATGLWIEHGKLVRPVSRVTVAGTLDEIFGGIAGVADDLVWDHPTKTPTFLVRQLAVSGT